MSGLNCISENGVFDKVKYYELSLKEYSNVSSILNNRPIYEWFSEKIV